MNKLRWLALLMGITIVGITGFQGYWLRDNYIREKQSLEIKTNAAFRQTILQLQAGKLHLEEVKMRIDTTMPPFINVRGKSNPSRTRRMPNPKEPPITVINLLQERARTFEAGGSLKSGRFIIRTGNDSLTRALRDSLQKLNHRRINGEVKSVILSETIDSGATNIISNTKSRPVTSGDSRLSITYSSDDSIPDIEKDVLFRRPMPSLTLRNKSDTSRNEVYQFLFDVDSLYIKDSVKVEEIDSAFKARLATENMNLAFRVSKLDSSHSNSNKANVVTVGFSKPASFQLDLTNPSSFILKKLKLPILFSLLLVGITIASFVLLYRNLLKQHRLGQIKNDLISNITHELKTPIATVSVAIEALKNFNAIDDPRRTKEYLDISQNELQRLELLVDKVLKLSMFENKQIALQKDNVNLEELVREVMASMKFQAEKQRAKLVLEISGDRFSINADKLHITSVIYNLLDNALKYSGDNAEVTIRLTSHAQHVEMRVTDNGIGIPAEYKNRVFDKFFRVPSGDKHTIKGYGLGLSYVDHIVKSHHGFIQVESQLGKGSTFIVNLPYEEQSEIDFGNGRKIKKHLKI